MAFSGRDHGRQAAEICLFRDKESCSLHMRDDHVTMNQASSEQAGGAGLLFRTASPLAVRQYEYRVSH